MPAFSLFAILGVAALRLRLRNRCGLGLNQNPPFLDGHQLNQKTGFNIGMNCEESAGQTVFHAHIHLIPRRDGDTPHPRGGVRGVIPGKMGYPAM